MSLTSYETPVNGGSCRCGCSKNAGVFGAHIDVEFRRSRPGKHPSKLMVEYFTFEISRVHLVSLL